MKAAKAERTAMTRLAAVMADLRTGLKALILTTKIMQRARASFWKNYAGVPPNKNVKSKSGNISIGC